MKSGRVFCYGKHYLFSDYFSNLDIKDRSIITSFKHHSELIFILKGFICLSILQFSIKNLAVLSSKQDFKLVEVSGACIVQVYGLKELRLGCIINASSDLKHSIRIPIVVKDLMLSKEETVKATRVHIHFLDRLFCTI